MPRTAPSISRNEGYRASAGKEEYAIQAAAGFLAQCLEVAPQELERITGADDNWLHGDLRLPNGATIEVKGQPVNPSRYPRNFMEVAEITNNPRHADGFKRLAHMMRLSEDELARITVTDYSTPGRPRTPLGAPPFLSVSITSMASAALTVYVNYVDGFLYAYQRDEILRILREQARKGLNRGQGRSNDDTLSVLGPLPRWIFSRDHDDAWVPLSERNADMVFDQVVAHVQYAA